MIPVVWASCLTLVGFTGWQVGRRIRQAARARAFLAHLREAVDALAREVGAGALPADALGAVAEHVQDPALGRVLSRAGSEVSLGADPQQVAAYTEGDPEAGAEGHVRHLLELWQLNRRHGVALAPLLDAYVRDLDAQLAHQSKAASAMAGARLTVIVLLALPVGAVLLGGSFGLNTAGLLLSTALGCLLLLVGVLLACGGVLWTEALTVRALGGVGGRAGPPVDRDLAAARILDVFAEALVAGATVPTAWSMAAAGVGANAAEKGKRSSPEGAVAALLASGAGPRAWEPLVQDGSYGPIARQAVHQTRSGFALAEGVHLHAGRLRRRAADTSTANAERVLIALAAPLTLCFLPAFVVVGLIPLVIGLAGL
ncbi:type II secretion system F family protein [Corynebacterium heidelbergense]|uniref:Type II secretion system protein GspF domain-containing protein n=1 Tax=Corynebacterium heidelbergense TaxID=2055947 RepID=A0A364V4Y8_9CORY|nr:type II secretion system F family protein [Corynebacterium heidelbergense]RAV31678.1 hypothetical protein DLJ54_07080 [Corynebacterium heidelbergense]